MYHVKFRELRQFGNVAHRFNLSVDALHALVEPWARGEQIEFGERKWSPHVASLTVIEGPELALSELSIGRGWRTASRKGEDVTERLLAAATGPARAAAAAAGGAAVGDASSAPAAAALGAAPELAATGAPSAASVAPAGSDLEADSLGLGVLSLLQRTPAPLSRAWRLAQARFPERSASESLALTERAVRSLLQRRLIVLVERDGDSADQQRHDDDLPGIAPERADQVLRTVECWFDTSDTAVRMRRV